MWHLNFAKLVGVSGHIKLNKEQQAMLDRLEIPRDGRHACDLESIRGKKIWDVLVDAFEGMQA